MAELFTFNNSFLTLQHPLNDTEQEETMYEYCANLSAIIIFYLVLQFINMVMGFPANLMVLLLIYKNRGDLSNSDIFIMHLAMLDVLFCLIPPLELANIIYLNNTRCWYVLRFFYGIKDLSPLFLSCICLDRYVAVQHPITFIKLKNRWHRSVCVAVVWLITVAYASAKCVGNIPNFDMTFTVMILASFTVMLFCNASILWALRQSAPGRDHRHPVKKAAFRIVLIILAIIVFNYLPPVVLFPFKEYFSKKVFQCYIHYIAFSFMDISSSIQPILYLSREMLLRCCMENTESAEESVFTIIQ